MERRYLILESSEERVDRTKKMVQDTCSAIEKVLIWSDEKIVTVEPQGDVQNDRIMAAMSASIRTPVRTVFSPQNLQGL